MINNRRKLESAGTLGKNMILTPCTLAYFTDIIVKLYKYMQGATFLVWKNIPKKKI